MILNLPENTKGRDFIIGDLHGCWHQLMIKMAGVDFDEKVDRLFSTGDIIDRGPHSMKCLSLLEQPYFFMVQGNHEQMLLNWLGRHYSSYTRPMDFLYNGGSWAEKEDRAKLNHYANLIEKLPLVIEVGDGPSGFNIAHSRYESTPTEETREEFVWDRSLLDIRYMKNNGTRDTWNNSINQTIFITPYDQSKKITYVGHTPTPGTNNRFMIRNQLMIDTRAYAGERGSSDHLTMINHKEFLDDQNYLNKIAN